MNPALNWAFKEQIPPSCKFVLVAMADFADAVNQECFASIETIAKKTSYNRKTVIAARAALVASGHIEKTSKKVGRTGLIPIYRVTMKPAQELDYSIFGNSPVGGPVKQSSRWAAEPSVMEPVLRGPTVNRELKVQSNPPLPPASGGMGSATKVNGNGHKPTTPEAKRMAALYRRRETTCWSQKEIRAFRNLGKIESDDLDVVEKYYLSESRKKENYCRRDLLTLLNNFPGEVDRARGWQEKKQRREQREKLLYGDDQ